MGRTVSILFSTCYVGDVVYAEQIVAVRHAAPHIMPHIMPTYLPSTHTHPWDAARERVVVRLQAYVVAEVCGAQTQRQLALAAVVRRDGRGAHGGRDRLRRLHPHVQ